MKTKFLSINSIYVLCLIVISCSLVETVPLRKQEDSKLFN